MRAFSLRAVHLSLEFCHANDLRRTSDALLVHIIDIHSPACGMQWMESFGKLHYTMVDFKDKCGGPTIKGISMERDLGSTESF